MKNLLMLTLGAMLLAYTPAAAEAPSQYPDFSAKRIGVPKPGARPKIVQIDPEEQAALLAAAAD